MRTTEDIDGQGNEIWQALLQTINQKLKREVGERHHSKATAWPTQFAELKRPHFEEMYVYIEAHKFKNKLKHAIPGVETLERCYKQPHRKRGNSTLNSLSIYAGYSSYEAFKLQYLAIKPVKVQLSLAQSRVHMEFQGRIRDLQQHLPHTIADQAFETENELELRYITLYFFLVFDEYHVCKVISPNELGVLWDEFYCKGVAVALKRPAFKKRLLSMFEEEDDFAFFGLKEAFQNEIESIYLKTYGLPIHA